MPHTSSSPHPRPSSTHVRTARVSAQAGPLRIAIRLWDWSAWGREIVRGVQSFAHERPRWRLYVDTGFRGAAQYLQQDIHWDGIIAATLNEVSAWKRILKVGRSRIVTTTAFIPQALQAIPSVRVDDNKVAASIGRHLLAGGFRRIAYYGGALPGLDYRAKALASFAEAEGLPFDLYSSKSFLSPAVHMPSLVRWVARLPKPIGIVGWNMDVARRLVEACRRAAVSVPEQAAIVGWDDDVMLAETSEPTITGAVLPAERLGFEGAKLLDQLLNGNTPPAGPVLVEPSGMLHVRQSSDAMDLPDRDVHLAVQYIREHGTEPLKVSNMAHVLRVSRRKLEQDFRRVTGRGVYEAMQDVRLQKARQLLLESDWTMERIARVSGLGTKDTLRRLIARREKMTPSEYRKRFGNL